MNLAPPGDLTHRIGAALRQCAQDDAVVDERRNDVRRRETAGKTCDTQTLGLLLGTASLLGDTPALGLRLGGLARFVRPARLAFEQSGVSARVLGLGGPARYLCLLPFLFIAPFAFLRRHAHCFFPRCAIRYDTIVKFRFRQREFARRTFAPDRIHDFAVRLVTIGQSIGG